MQSLPKCYILVVNKIRIDMLINQLSDIQEEQVTDKKATDKKYTPA